MNENAPSGGKPRRYRGGRRNNNRARHTSSGPADVATSNDTMTTTTTTNTNTSSRSTRLAVSEQPGSEGGRIGPFTVVGGELQGPNTKAVMAASTKKKKNRKNRKQNSAEATATTAAAISAAVMETKTNNGTTTRTNGATAATKSSHQRRKKKDESSVAGQTARLHTQLRFLAEQNDAHGLHELLQQQQQQQNDKNNPLDISLIESILKVYIRAAMFEQATHFLQNFHRTSGEQLSVSQLERLLVKLPQTTNLESSGAKSLEQAAVMMECLCQATVFDYVCIRNYFLKIVQGIALEFLQQAQAARHRICTLPAANLVREGLCLENVQLEHRKRGKGKNKVGDFIVVTDQQQQQQQQNKGIQAGDVVAILPYQGPEPMDPQGLDGVMTEAIVTNCDPIVLRLHDKKDGPALISKLTQGNSFRLDKLANRTCFHRQLAAAVVVTTPAAAELEEVAPVVKTKRDPRRPCPQLVQVFSFANETNESSVLNHGGSEPSETAKLCGQAVPWKRTDEKDAQERQGKIRATHGNALEKYGTLNGLDDLQKDAVERATSDRLTLVQGSRGNTAVPVRILQHWTKLAEDPEEQPEDDGVAAHPILVTSESNVAIDGLMAECVAVGLRVARLGQPEAINDELLPFCLDQPSSRTETSAPPFKERVRRLQKAQVVFSCVVDSARDILDALGSLERVLVVEATHVKESTILIALVRGCRQVVLVGDRTDLESSVVNQESGKFGNGVALFSRMIECGVSPLLLESPLSSEDEVIAELSEAKDAKETKEAENELRVTENDSVALAVEVGDTEREVMRAEAASLDEKAEEKNKVQDAEDDTHTRGNDSIALPVERSEAGKAAEEVVCAEEASADEKFGKEDPFPEPSELRDLWVGAAPENALARGMPSLDQPAAKEVAEEQKDCECIIL